MAATCFLRDIVQQKGHHQTVWFTIMLLRFIAVAGLEELILLKGHVGGDAVFRCLVEPHVKYDTLYLQKGNVFVNGFYKSKDMNKYHPWPNSRVDEEHKVIIMSGLNISHAGLYTCYLQKTGDSNMDEKNIELTVTANYSKPSILNCADKKDPCLVQCSAHGGYPKKKIIWNTSEGHLSTKDNSTEDNNTLLLNISSVASFNCSTGNQQNISCSVDHRVSAVLSICEQESAPEKSHLITIIVIITVVPSVLLFGIIFCCRNRIRRSCGSDNNSPTSCNFDMLPQNPDPE